MSAAVASGKPARNAPNAEYSIVLSSETRKAATLATQKTGQGDVLWSGASAAAAAGTVAMVMWLSPRECGGSGALRQVARRGCRTAPA